MGNCLPSHGSGRVSQELMGSEEFIMVTRSDGKIMEYTAPLLVRDLMAVYPQHSVVHSKDATCRFLSPDKKLVPGQLYRLLLIPNSPSLSKDAVLSEAKSIENGRISRLLLIPNSPSLSKDAVLSEAKSIENGRISRETRASTRPPSSVKSVKDGSGITRVKMVISKRELEALLSDHRCMKEKSLLVQLQCKAQYVKEDYIATRRCSNDGWRPSLESIREVN